MEPQPQTAAEQLPAASEYPDWPLAQADARRAELFAAEMHAAMLRRDGYVLLRDSSVPFWFNGSLVTDITGLDRAWRDAQFGPMIQGAPQVMAISPGTFQAGGLADSSRWFAPVGLQPQDVVVLMTFARPDGGGTTLVLALRRLERGFLLAGLQN